MKIHKIELKNFRAIEEQSFSFREQFSVLIGDNGTGKTTILDALAFSLGTIFRGIGEVNTLSLKESDKRRVMVNPNSEELKLPLSVWVKHSYLGEKYEYCRIAKKAKGGSTSYKEANDLITHVEQVCEQVREGKQKNLPLVAYYGVGRLTDDIFERKAGKRTASRFEGYNYALSPRTMQPKALEWMRDATTSSLQQFEEDEHTMDKGLLVAFTNTLETLIPDWTKVNYHLKKEEVIGLQKGKNWQYLSNLSAGYKAIAKLAMDIAYRAVTLNPHMGTEAVTETSGVVLIDEIDMHLHPKWQRRIVESLKKAFPNIQFIVTTHSPFIVQSLKAEEVINLDQPSMVETVINSLEELDELPLEINAEDPLTKSLEEVVRDEMGIEDVRRSEAFRHYQKLAANYFDLIEQGKSSESDTELATIKAQLDEMELEFTNDPVYLALMKAERRAELKQ